MILFSGWESAVLSGSDAVRSFRFTHSAYFSLGFVAPVCTPTPFPLAPHTYYLALLLTVWACYLRRGRSGKLLAKCSEPQVVCESESEEVEPGEIILPYLLPYIPIPNSKNHHSLNHQAGLPYPLLYIPIPNSKNHNSLNHQAGLPYPLPCTTIPKNHHALNRPPIVLPSVCQQRPASHILTQECTTCQAQHRKATHDSPKTKEYKGRLRCHASHRHTAPHKARKVRVPGSKNHGKEKLCRDVNGNEVCCELCVKSLLHPEAGGQLTGGFQCQVSARESGMSRLDGLEVVREIGRGTFGSVWLVRWPGSFRNLVLKCVDLTYCNDGEVEAARQEVHILAGLKHPNIVSYKGSFEVRGRLNLLMGYCAGGDLATLIKRQRGILFSEVKIVRWLIQITMALQYLHSHHILHRDLKTQNIFLTRSGLIKLGDFGISRILGSSQDMATTLVGTPYYMSPELFAGLPYNHKSDIWALGCCLYELATHRHAFPARNLPGLISKISKGKIHCLDEQYSDDLRYLVLSLMTRNPEQRPSASEVLRLGYIRQHMSLFLKDTSDTETEPEHQSTEKKRSSPEVLQDSGVFGVQSPSHEGRQADINNGDRVTPSRHYVARRFCESAPSEFESLKIAGDRIRLEERDRRETKPSGNKECHCPRREKQQQPPPTCSNSGHLHSQSRIRRRGSKELENNRGSNQGHVSPSVTPSHTNQKDQKPLHFSLSARERRRQQRSRGTENGNPSTSAQTHLEEKNSSEDSCSPSSAEDSDEQSNSETLTNTLTQDYEEEEEGEFLKSLSSTLTEASNANDEETEDDDGGLEEKIKELEEYLMGKMGKVQGRLIMKVLYEEEEEEDWEARLREVEQLVGSKLEPEVASTAWHLRLCYILQHN